LTDPQCFHRRWLSAVIATVAMLLLALIGPVAAQAQPSDALAEAQALYEQGQLSQALARVEAALAEGNTDSAAELRFLQGLIASEQGRSDDAIEIFTALTVSHPDLAAPYNNLAVLYSQAGEVDKALDALRAAVDARPDYAVGHENLGDLYVKLAARSYSRSLAEDDENRSARLKFSAVGEFIAQSADLFGSAPAAPEAEPAAADPASADLTDAERARIEREVTDALTLWRLAWSGQNADAYFAAYSADFVPRGSPRAEWLQRKRELINAPENIDVIVEDVRVDVLAADRARVRFLQRYRSDRYEDEGTKILEFRRIGRRWQIEREANVSRRSAARVLPVDQRVGTDERTEPATVDQSLIAAALAPRLVPPPRQPQAAPALTAELTRPEGRAESDALFQPDPEARSEAPPPQPAPDAPLSPSDKLSPPERDLLLAMDHLRRGDHDAALQASRTLLQQRPDFELARALAADVEAAGHDEPTRLDWSPTAPAAAHPRWEDDPLAALQAEIAQRWAHRDFDADGRIPDVLVHVAPEVRHVIVVETATSRLYLFRNRREGLELTADFYVSIGRAGAGKQAEGDLRTPLGVYFTLSRMDDGTLADRYGAHAFPLNYPNKWDRHQQRTGRGIWLHGVPHDTYTRPPRDSEGCVAMSNADIHRLARTLNPRFTPVVITEQVTWVAPEVLTAQASVLRERAQAWHATRLASAGDDSGVLTAAFYEQPPGSQYRATIDAGGDEMGEIPQGRVDFDLPIDDERALSRMNVFAYPGEPDMVLISFDEPAASDGARAGWRRQYWRRGEDGVWRISEQRTGKHRRR
jgi:tetratricopeptide (TPR) repeat protein